MHSLERSLFTSHVHELGASHVESHRTRKCRYLRSFYLGVVNVFRNGLAHQIARIHQAWRRGERPLYIHVVRCRKEPDEGPIDWPWYDRSTPLNRSHSSGKGHASQIPKVLFGLEIVGYCCRNPSSPKPELQGWILHE